MHQVQLTASTCLCSKYSRKKRTVYAFSDHNRSLPRRQPGQVHSNCMLDMVLRSVMHAPGGQRTGLGLRQTCCDCCCCWRSSCWATAATTAVAADPARVGGGRDSVCTADTLGTCTITGEPTPVKALLARELLASVILPAAVPRTTSHCEIACGTGKAQSAHDGGCSPQCRCFESNHACIDDFCSVDRAEGFVHSRPKHCKDASALWGENGPGCTSEVLQI